MTDAINKAVDEEWTVIYESADERTIACVSGQAEIWRSSAAPVADAIGLPMVTGGSSLRGSGRILGRAAVGTRRAVFIIL